MCWLFINYPSWKGPNHDLLNKYPDQNLLIHIIICTFTGLKKFIYHLLKL